MQANRLSQGGRFAFYFRHRFHVVHFVFPDWLWWRLWIVWRAFTCTYAYSSCHTDPGAFAESNADAIGGFGYSVAGSTHFGSRLNTTFHCYGFGLCQHGRQLEGKRCRGR
jgi:hypothetical protein